VKRRGSGAVASGGAAGQRRNRGDLEGPAAVGTLLRLLARALSLDRAALLAETRSGDELVPVSAHGAAPPAVPVGELPPGRWSAVIPVHARGRSLGLLLLERRRRGLTPGDRGTAEAIAELFAHVLDAGALADELTCARELLARADRLAALGTLSAGLAHEIRNPLVSVRTFIQLLPERLADEEFRTGFRELALGEVERICGLINDLLAFSRPAPATREPTDLNALVGQIVRLLDAEARKRDVDMSSDVEDTLPLITVDDGQVKQVLMNILLNALQACPPRGQVRVTTETSTRDEKRWCVVRIADSGPGIAPEHLEHIFDPFFTTKAAGSGLGLYIAHQIVAAHGGDIRASARTEGGTEFVIYFPADAEAEGDARAR